MYDVSEPSQLTLMNTTAAVLIASGSAFLDRIVIGAAAASTINIYVTDKTAASTNTTSDMKAHLVNGPQKNQAVEIGGRFDNGIVVFSSAKVKLTAVFKNS